MKRSIPRQLHEAWQQATEHEDPLRALQSSRALHQHLAGWQATLVAEALQGGVTWEEIGAALGATRQAAWARFRKTLDPKEARDMTDARSATVGEIKELQEQLRIRDQRWHHERQAMQGDLQAAQARLKSLDQQRAADRQSIQAQLQQKKAALRELTGKVRESGRWLQMPPGSGSPISGPPRVVPGPA